MLITDRQEISTARKYTDEGFLVVPAIISRSGIQEYYAFELGLTDRASTDIIKVWRPDEEVFHQDSLNSFKNKVVTDNHPSVLVNAENAKDYSVGFSSSEVTKDGIFAKTILHFTVLDAINKVENGKVEISNGYTADLEWTEGVTLDGEKYDAIQRNIRGNHIALVERGRCGSACRVSDQKPPNGELAIMAKITVDGVDFEVSDQVAQAVQKQQRRLADAEEEASKLKKDLEEEKTKAKAEDEDEEEEKETKKQMDTLKAQLDDAKAKVPTPEMLDKLVGNRIATRDAALKINPEYKWEGKDCATIRKEIVSEFCTDVNTSKESADYIAGRFSALTQLADSSDSIDSAFKALVNKDKKVEVKDTVAEARQRMIDRNKNAYKKAGGDK